jgi:NAD(P)H-nitrite reductase large subunit
MKLDDEICYCFHVSRRKLVNFARRTLPQVPSQLSECGGAGTGCGWCIPFLKQIFRQEMTSEDAGDLERLTPADYANQRAEYVRAGGGIPAPGATPLPPIPRS